LGDGKDEITELFRCTEMLPAGVFLAVKENPEMIGVRKVGFYRKLRRNKRIILMDPYASTPSLISNSLGVVGISGTVLLEAAMVNKPSCALGHPEFDAFLIGHGWNSFKDFVDTCIQGDYKSPATKILPYLAYVLDNSSESDIALGGNLGSQEAEDMALRYAEQILSKIH
jgi:hypothetical protein